MQEWQVELMARDGDRAAVKLLRATWTALLADIQSQLGHNPDFLQSDSYGSAQIPVAHLVNAELYLRAVESRDRRW